MYQQCSNAKASYLYVQKPYVIILWSKVLKQLIQVDCD